MNQKDIETIAIMKNIRKIVFGLLYKFETFKHSEYFETPAEHVVPISDVKFNLLLISDNMKKRSTYLFSIYLPTSVTSFFSYATNNESHHENCKQYEFDFFSSLESSKQIRSIHFNADLK